MKNRKNALQIYLIKLSNICRSVLTNPVHLLSILALIFLVYTIVIPLWEIISQSFQWQLSAQAITVENKTEGLTLFNWQRVFASSISKPLFYVPVYNSLKISAGVSILSLVLGGGLAWLVTRTDFSHKSVITFLAILPYMLPSWVTSFAWLAVFKNNKIGGSQGILQSLLGINPPDWLAYGYLPIVLTLTLNYFTFFFLLISVALSSISSDLEETAEIMGAGKLKVLIKVTFPLVIPAVFSAFILTFSKSMGSFGVPAFLGLPVKYYTISTMIHSSIQNRMTAEAYILSIILLLICGFMIFMNQKVIGQRKSYVTIGGKASGKNHFPLGKWKRPVTWLILGVMGIAVFTPIVILILRSFMFMDGNFNPNNFTLHFWIGDSNSSIASGEVGVLKNQAIISALKNSLMIALTGAMISSCIGLLMGYVIMKERKTFLSKIIEQLSFAPYMIPGIAFSAIYLSMFAKKTFGFIPVLYGSISLIILISVVNELPFAVRSGTSAMLQIGKELEEAAAMQGASWRKRFFYIILPICKKSLFGSFLLLFISLMKELDLIILLVTPKTRTLTTLLFDYAEHGYQQFSNVIMVIIVIIILITYSLAKRIGKVDLAKGIGG